MIYRTALQRLRAGRICQDCNDTACLSNYVGMSSTEVNTLILQFNPGVVRLEHSPLRGYGSPNSTLHRNLRPCFGLPQRSMPATALTLPRFCLSAARRKTLGLESSRECGCTLVSAALHRPRNLPPCRLSPGHQGLFCGELA